MIKQNKAKILLSSAVILLPAVYGIIMWNHLSGYDGGALGRGWNHRWNRRKGAGGLWSAASVFAGASVLSVADASRSGESGGRAGRLWR